MTKFPDFTRLDLGALEGAPAPARPPCRVAQTLAVTAAHRYTHFLDGAPGRPAQAGDVVVVLAHHAEGEHVEPVIVERAGHPRCLRVFPMVTAGGEVHIMANGRIVKSGGPELALEVENNGYADILAEVA